MFSFSSWHSMVEVGRLADDGDNALLPLSHTYKIPSIFLAYKQNMLSEDAVKQHYISDRFPLGSLAETKANIPR